MRVGSLNGHLRPVSFSPHINVKLRCEISIKQRYEADMYEIFPKKIDPDKAELEFRMMIRAFLDVAREELAREKQLLKPANRAPRPTQ